MEALVTWFTTLLSSNPIFGVLLSVIGASRLVFKSLLTLIELVTRATPSKKDDDLIPNFRKSKIYGTILWVLDLLTSIKVKKG